MAMWEIMACGLQWMNPPSPVGAYGCPHGCFPTPPNPSSCLLRTTSFASVLSAAPSFMSVLVGGGSVFEPLTPCAPPPPPLFLFCPRHPTHSADYNSNVFCRIPGHQLALIPPLIIPTTDYVLHLEHKPLQCGAGINKHTRDRPHLLFLPLLERS